MVSNIEWTYLQIRNEALFGIAILFASRVWVGLLVASILHYFTVNFQFRTIVCSNCVWRQSKGKGKIVKTLGSHRSRATWMDWAHSKQPTTEANVERPGEQTWRLSIWIFCWPSRNIRRWGFFIWRGRLLSSTRQSLRLQRTKCYLSSQHRRRHQYIRYKSTRTRKKANGIRILFLIYSLLLRRISLSDSYRRRRNLIICPPTPLLHRLSSLSVVQENIVQVTE